MYDGGVEVPSTEQGFKIEVGDTAKNVEVEAKSELIESTWEDLVSYTSGSSILHVQLKRLTIPAGTYKQAEFLPILNKIENHSWYCNVIDGNPTSNAYRIDKRNNELQFKDYYNNTITGDIVIDEGGYFYEQRNIRGKDPVISSDTYPSVGYVTDYQMSMTIKPSANASYDGEYVEPLTEVEVDGIKFVPTTLTIDGVEYKVLAEAQPDEDPVDSTDSELTDGEVTDGQD